MKKLILFISTIFICSAVSAQNFAYRVRFDTYFDNLESSEQWEPTRTLFAVKLAPEIGLQLGGGHSLMVGANLIQDLGDTLLTHADYSVYYRYKSKRFGALAGSFSRRNSIGDYPITFFDNDWSFYNENIHGIMLQSGRKPKHRYIEFFVDWQGQDQKFRIDEFLLCASGRYSFFDRLLIFDAAGMLSHFKNDYVLQDSYLLERAFYKASLSTDLHKVIPLFDEFRLGFGTLSSMEHKRVLDTHTTWQHNIGFQAEADIRWKWVGLKNDFYFGDPQQTYYRQYSRRIYSGSPFYQSDRYNRTSLYGKWSKKFLSVKGEIILHATKGNVANQEMLTLSLDIHQMLKKGKPHNIK